MYKIVGKRLLVPNIYLMDVDAPRVAKAAKPGQFVIVKMDEKGERVPLTICDYDSEKGTVTIVFQSMGTSTKEMAEYEIGESFSDFVGPLGQPSEMVHEDIDTLKQKKIMFIAGGVGAAPVYPQVKWLNERGIKADVIMGSKTKDLLILEEDMKQVAGNVFVATDDGSYGFKGMVTDLIKDLVLNQGKHYDMVVAIGPMIMMKFVSKLTKELGIHTIVSLNPIMVDGTGMCGACRVTVGGETKFACVDGPEFDAHLVDFDEAMRRQTMYKTEEAKSEFRKSHSGGGCCSCSDNK
ncbi:sulfide/dihydroorotate dehydrogenase-like FAD/NAD-binding protein [Candidatus Clostridium radicumherbarum]|uniref:Sulfide/dihydroorotate dehydrogenase-like FAD/NAD-binding protein n=1 Tax=Candidatus Clostridium radicumherbarum TaxID=3381662 RepID=A0ABW8TS65_9CLOT